MTASRSTSVGSKTLGSLVIAVAVLGALFAAALLVVPAAVRPEIWSYPLAALPFLLGQVFVGLHHVVLAVGLLAAWRIGLAGQSRLAAFGAVSTTIVMTAFAVVEVVSGLAADETVTSGFAGALTGLYGGLTILLAITSIIYGVAILRAHAWSGATRATVLVTGIFLVVPMIPAQFDPLFWGRIAVGVWSLLYVGLGLGLRRGASS